MGKTQNTYIKAKKFASAVRTPIHPGNTYASNPITILIPKMENFAKQQQ
jgi:hypothetical protein